MREPLPEFGGKDEARVGRDAVDPLGGVVGPNGIVERGVDLNSVEEFGQISCFVKAFAAARRVNVTEPVWIGPASWAYADYRFGSGSVGVGG